MNDETQTEEVSEIPSELETLKKRADLMNIKYHPKIGLDKLKAKIELVLEPNTEPKVSTTQLLNTTINKKKYHITHDQFLKERTTQIRKNVNRLVRIRVSCMNPNKSQWEGEIISVGSAKLGTFKKYVPFNAEDGWHVPSIIYDAMKERKYSAFTTVKGPRGEKIRKGKLVPEFNIEVLPPLNTAELKALAQRQAMAGSIEH